MLLQLLIVSFILLIIPSLLMVRYILPPTWSKKKKGGFLLLHLILWIIVVLTFILLPLSSQNGNTLGTILLPIYGLSFGEIAFLIPALIFNISNKQKVRIAGKFLGGFTCALAIFSLTYGFYKGSGSFVKPHFTLSSTRIPKEFHNFKIIQLTDLHLGTFDRYPHLVSKIIRLVNSENPDLIVFTGDLVNFSSQEIKPYLATLKQLKAKYGVYSVMGNHDYGGYTSAFTPEERHKDMLQLQQLQKNLGWTLLLNQHKVLKLNRDSIIIAGTENFTSKIQKGNLSKTLDQSPKNLFTLLLTHAPSFWNDSVKETPNIDLTLAGHVHGFQYNIFGFSPTTLWKGFEGGAYRHQNNILYLSRGVGMSAIFPVRFGAWPEINIITLKHIP